MPTSIAEIDQNFTDAHDLALAQAGQFLKSAPTAIRIGFYRARNFERLSEHNCGSKVSRFQQTWEDFQGERFSARVDNSHNEVKQEQIRPLTPSEAGQFGQR